MRMFFYKELGFENSHILSLLNDGSVKYIEPKNKAIDEVMMVEFDKAYQLTCDKTL